MSLVNWSSINGASQEYHQTRTNLEKIDNYINKTIEDNTVDELHALKKATENYFYITMNQMRVINLYLIKQ